MKQLNCRKRWSEIWRESKSLLLTILVITAARSAIADWNDVPSGSMNPTIIEGDRVFVNKLAYDLKVPFTTCHLAQWADPKRGDIVVFFSPVDGTRLVKRVIGLPGDRVELANEQLLVNGRPADYQPLPQSAGSDVPASKLGPRFYATEKAADAPDHPVMWLPGVPAKRSFAPVSVPAGCYFMMGDNRDNSNDSRYWGTVDRRQIVGRVSMVVISLDRQKHLTPRWHRFFTHLL